MNIHVFGWIGGSIAIVNNIPQIYKIYTIKSCNDISQLSICMRILSYIFYIVHGIIVNDPALLWMTAIGSFQLIFILFQTLYYKNIHIIPENETN